MTVPADTAQKTLQLAAKLRTELGDLLYEILSKEEHSESGIGPDMAVSASVSSLVNLALKVAVAGGLGPGDFIKTLHLLIEHIEKTYGNECRGGVELETRSIDDIDREVLAGNQTKTELN